jgi:hypothetical protein
MTLSPPGRQAGAAEMPIGSVPLEHASGVGTHGLVDLAAAAS